ncbi:MAG: TonB-dependent receptor [Gemmatimonadales bacterium]|nr:MAG: TonB-dependent receptor [Gemmatimonadales bacterium]
MFSKVTGLLVILAAVMAAPEALYGSNGAIAADTLRGRVTGPSGGAVPGVEVVIPELSRRVRTSHDGRFTFVDLPPGRHTVVFRSPGYLPAREVVEIRGSAELDVQLSLGPFELEPVVVTGTPEPVEPIASVLPVATLNYERLRRQESVSIAHLLERVAGVRTLSTGMQVGKPVIRGLTGSRVLVAEGGLRLEDYAWSDEDGPSVDARLADRIEVVKGPASLMYGSDALGGVVNVIPEPLPEAGAGLPRATVELYGASNNREVGGLLRLRGSQGPLGWSAVVVGRSAGDLHTPAGELGNTGYGALNGQLAAGLRRHWGSIALRYTRYGGEFKLLEAEGPPPGEGMEGEEEEGPERKLSDDRVMLEGKLLAGTWRFETRAQWQRHWLQELADEPVGPGEPVVRGRETVQFDLLLNTFAADVLAHHRLGSAGRGTLGISGTFQDNDTRGPRPIVPDAQTRGIAVFGVERLNLGMISVLAGVRFDARALDASANAELGNPDTELDWSSASGDVGFLAEPIRGLALSVNLARGWRAPTLFELFARGPRIGEARYEVGRPDLQVERGTNLDLGLRWMLGPVLGSIEVYRNSIDNYVYLAPTGELRDGLRVYEHRQGDALLRGVEVTGEVQPLADLAVRAKFDAVEGTNRASGEPLPLMPPPRGTLEAEYQSSELPWVSRGYASFEVEKNWTQRRLSEFDFPTDGYVLLNLGAGLEKTYSRRTFRLDLRVTNLADAKYRSFLSRYKEFALNPGRNIVLRLGYDF